MSAAREITDRDEKMEASFVAPSPQLGSDAARELMGTNHFITVSKQGVLMARRKGQSPIAVTTAAEGLSVSTERPALPTIRVFFGHGGGNRMLHILTVGVGEQRVPIETFQSEHAVTDEELGRWIRMAIEKVLDARPR